MIRLLFYLVPLVIGIFIFYDLKKLGRSSIAFVVASACTMFFPIGPLIYLGLRQRLKLTPSINLDNSFCSRCGYSPIQNKSICPKCGNELTI